VPPPRRRAYVEHLQKNVALSGRLVVGVFYEETEDAATEAALSTWGIEIAGRSERPHPDTEKLRRRVLWIDGHAR
jgi:hypothetical protein